LNTQFCVYQLVAVLKYNLINKDEQKKTAARQPGTGKTKEIDKEKSMSTPWRGI